MIDADPELLERNLSALRPRDPALVRRIEASAPDPSLKAERSRDGSPVPFILSGKRPIYLHSRYAPLKEAERLATERSGDGYCVCLGLGGGYQARAILGSRGTSGILLVETSIPLVRATLERVDVSDILRDGRVSVMAEAGADECARILADNYLPVLSGGLRTLPLRPRIDADPAGFKEAMDRIGAAVERIASDFSVQSIFGKRWFSNALMNLERSSGELAEIRVSGKVLVAAAGPSLEAQAGALRRAQGEGGFLLSTDTALPFLLASSIEPDAVISLDCQHISYRHFVPGRPSGLPLVMELTSPPILSRTTRNVAFFVTGNPLGAFFSRKLRRLPRLDASGGNVTHAAISLAEALGAEEVRLFGADYSYPRGKTYARGTHLYASFMEEAGRLAPLESRMADILFRSPSLSREREGGILRYRNPVLDSYRDAAKSLASRSRARIVQEGGEGLRISEGGPMESSGNGRETALGHLSAGRLKASAREVLIGFRDGIEALRLPEEPLLPSIRSSGGEEADLWLALLPLAAAVTRDEGITRPRDALARARLWALARLRAYFQAWPAGKP
jgi:hypothetical protein